MDTLPLWELPAENTSVNHAKASAAGLARCSQGSVALSLCTTAHPLVYSVPLFLKRQCDRTLGAVPRSLCMRSASKYVPPESDVSWGMSASEEAALLERHRQQTAAAGSKL